MWICALCEATEKGTAVKRAGPKAPICSWCADQLAKRAHAFCRKCRQPRPLPMGTAHKGAWCVECDKAYMRAKYERNREERLAYQRQYHDAHREEGRVRNRIYRATHRAQINARKRARDHANPMVKRASDARWRAKNPDYQRTQGAKWRAANPGYGRLYRARRKLAIIRGWK